jgi:predicted dithiol-disulfide oxidoreductase (DUF899 family)
VSARHDRPAIVDRATWNDAGGVLVQQEKALTRMKDAISTGRRRLPMVEVRPDYAFDGPGGTVTLLDLFEGRRQLIVQHFMRGRRPIASLRTSGHPVASSVRECGDSVE